MIIVCGTKDEIGFWTEKSLTRDTWIWIRGQRHPREVLRQGMNMRSSVFKGIVLAAVSTVVTTQPLRLTVWSPYIDNTDICDVQISFLTFESIILSELCSNPGRRAKKVLSSASSSQRNQESVPSGSRLGRGGSGLNNEEICSFRIISGRNGLTDNFFPSSSFHFCFFPDFLQWTNIIL